MKPYELIHYQTREEFVGPDIEAIESLQDYDGTRRIRYPLIEESGGLLIREELAPKLRDYLNGHGCIVAERRIITPLDSYIVFRVFNLYNDNPQAPVFRMWRSPNSKEMSVWQFASVEFVDWLKVNFDTSGLEFHYIHREEPFAKILKSIVDP